MFTGIVEGLAELISISHNDTNATFSFISPFDEKLKIDQSIAHNGVCLTVVDISENTYKVTAIEETLSKTNLNQLKIGDFVNIERCMKIGDRLDGHIVQGHVDQIGKCVEVNDRNGSWIYTFTFDQSNGNIVVEKGSICINGTSLTVVNANENQFSVCIIPYTYENTVFKYLVKDTFVNLEFDIIGKYVQKLHKGFLN